MLAKISLIMWFALAAMELEEVDSPAAAAEFSPAAANPDLALMDHPNGTRFTSGGINLEIMGRLIQQAYPKIETAQGRDIILVLGNLGAGKSTLVNYLLGCKMKKERQGTRMTAVPEEGQREYAKIGHSFSAQTLFPEVYANNDVSAYCYGDCPGFEDNRSAEERICASVSTEMVVNKADNIKVMIVVDSNSFKVDKAASFRRLSNTLSKLFNNLPELRFPFLFVISKADADTDVDDVVKDVNDIYAAEIKNLNSQFETIRRGALRFFDLPQERKQDIQDTQAMLGFLQLMLQSPQNIHVVNIFDDQRSSKQQIEQALAELPNIEKTSFNFSRYDDMRVKFNEVIYKLTGDAVGVLKQKRDLPRRIAYYRKQIEDADRRITFYANQIASGRFAVALNGDRIQDLRNKIAGQRQRRDQLAGRITEITNRPPMQYWSDDFHERRLKILWLFKNPFSWSEHTFHYEDIPFVRVKESPVDCFDERRVNGGAGRYSSRYRSDRGEDGYARVEIWVAPNRHPSNTHIIQTLHEQVNQIDMHINSLRGAIVECENADRTTGEGRRAQFEARKRHFEELKQMFERSLEVSNALLPQVEGTYERNAILIRTTYNIVTSLPLDDSSALIADFKSLYEHKDDPMQEIEIILAQSLCDPIGQDPLIDPVQTKCGHTFNHLEIMAWLQSGHHTCPVCRSAVREAELTFIPALADVVEELLRNAANT